MKWDLEINAPKTEYSVVGGGGQDIELRIKVKRTTCNFKYFGVIITYHGYSVQDIKSRMGQATQLNGNRITFYVVPELQTAIK